MHSFNSTGMYDSRCDEINEIINYRPHWIARNGNLIFFLIFLFFAGITWAIRIPEIVKSKGKIFQILDKNNFNINQGQPIYSAELEVAEKDGAKLKRGQKVIMKTTQYAEAEFMYLTGIISEISVVQNEKVLVVAELSSNLKINNNRVRLFQKEIPVQAEIITDNRKLFDRLVGKLMRAGEQ